MGWRGNRFGGREEEISTQMIEGKADDKYQSRELLASHSKLTSSFLTSREFNREIIYRSDSPVIRTQVVRLRSSKYVPHVVTATEG